MESRREPITPAGYERLLKEIEHIKSVERPRNIKAIEEARAHGDLSENAEYSAAKEEQSMIASRLARCEDLMARAEIIDPTSYKGKEIVFGAKVKLVDVETDDELTYRIVGLFEADASKGMISIDSPIARGLIGKLEGDEVRIKTPRGERQLAILSVEYS